MAKSKAVTKDEKCKRDAQVGEGRNRAIIKKGRELNDKRNKEAEKKRGKY